MPSKKKVVREAREPLSLPSTGIGRLSGSAPRPVDRGPDKMEMLPAVPGWHVDPRPLVPDTFSNTFPEYRRG